MRKKLLLSLILLMVAAYGALAGTLIGGLEPTLGLDLQGGVSVTQQPKTGTDYNSSSLDLAVEKIRDRVDALGVAEPEILRQGDTIVVNLPGVTDQEQAINLVQVTGQVYLRPVLQQCFDINPQGTDTTVAGTDDTGVPGPGDSTVPDTGAATSGDVASDATPAPGPGRSVSGTNTTIPGDTTTSAGSDTTVSGSDTTLGHGTTSQAKY